jgi:hypothetical protein
MARLQYEGTQPTNQSCIRNEIRSRLKSDNFIYLSDQLLSSSQLLYRNVRNKIYSVLIVTYLAQVWNLVCYTEWRTWAEDFQKIQCLCYVCKMPAQSAGDLSFRIFRILKHKFFSSGSCSFDRKQYSWLLLSNLGIILLITTQGVWRSVICVTGYCEKYLGLRRTR